ncbi:MAG: sigma-54-dependent Fis family transcriptional regulator [Bdellovibrio sp.]|nr:sigma-54-dependent Fis family transcriptional regulator [Bdellovibrio sp.]
MRLVIIDDDPTMGTTLKSAVEDSHEVTVFNDPIAGIAFLEKHAIDLVITDQQMPGMLGIDLIKKAKTFSPETSFILMTAYASIQDAVSALQNGASDYILKPLNLTEFDHRLKRIEELRAQGRQISLRQQKCKGLSRLLGQSENMKAAKEFAAKVADVPSSILILGQTGTGKEVLARSIHESSKRAFGPFVAINCATLGKELMDSELFGHEKGAFTGAVDSRQGKFELAEGGTIFLDEIGELSYELQAKLLRVLQEKEFYRVGGQKSIHTTARVIAATHRDLLSLSKLGSFREDLFFRLNVLSFTLLPLSARTEDLKALIEFFWKDLCQELKRHPKMNAQVESKLMAYDYPGNIRELKNILERLIVLGEANKEVSATLLPLEVSKNSPAPALTSSTTQSQILTEGKGLNQFLEEIEFRIIKDIMKQESHNQIKAAKRLQITRGSLQYKLKKIEDLGGC